MLVVLLVLSMAVVLMLKSLLDGTGPGVPGWTGTGWEAPTVESHT